jgi:hypothetical protein
MANYHYLTINRTTGEVYEKSKTPKDGFVKHVYTDKASGEEKANYHKYYKENIEGELVDVRYTPSDYGDTVSFTLQDGEEQYIFQTPFESSGKFPDVDEFAYDLICKINNLEKGTVYKVSPYVYTPEPAEGKKERTYRGITFWKDDTKIEKDLTISYYSALKDKDGKIEKDKDGNIKTELVEGDIPAVEWSQDKRGKWKMDASEKIDYLYETFNNYCTLEFGNEENTPQEETQKPQSQSKTVENTVSEDDVDDTLPF